MTAPVTPVPAILTIGAHNVYDVKEMLRFGDRHD